MHSSANTQLVQSSVVTWLLSLVFLALCSQCTSANPDYPDAFSCTLGSRSCASPTAGQPAKPTVCGRDASDSLALLTESCPTAAACDSGRCTASVGAKSCQQQSDCASGQSCIPLVSGSALALFCLQNSPANQPAGTACTVDSDCQSGFCLQHAGGRSCLLACSGSQCQRPAVCQTLNITVTGIQGTVGSCGTP
jgi:hypothetical protein